MSKQRLSKVLASAGIASRRACEELIFQGRVKVNGVVVSTPVPVELKTDQILVDGKPITAAEEKVYFLLNKPRGYICSSVSTKSGKSVLELFPDRSHRLFTVGRLDKDTEGLILLTNDGHFAHAVIHPSADIHKEYLAKTDQEITHEHLIAISNGALVEGTFVKPHKVSKVRKGTLKVVVGEGKKREVRILLESVGLTLYGLTRIRLGGLHLGTLPVGSFRELTERDKELIFNG